MTTKHRPRNVRRPRTKPPPLSAYKTVGHEIKSLRDAYGEYAKLARANHSHSELKNTTLEAFLLHVRNLRVFFIGTNNNDDILAIDFMNPRPRFRLPMLHKLRHRLDKRLAHPSYKRARGKKQWPVGALLAELTEPWNLFLRRLATANPLARAVFAREFDNSVMADHAVDSGSVGSHRIR